MNVPRVLVLLACRNGSPWLAAQIASILAQEDVYVRIEVGDDASCDDSVAIAREFQQRDDRVVVREWTEASGSAGSSFRRMFREVDTQKYDFVALADQDDIWLPRKLIAASERLVESRAVGYSCAVSAFWENGRQAVVRQNPVIRGADFLFEGAGQGCTFVVRQAFFAKAQRYCVEYPREVDSLHYHDWLLYLLARVWGECWYFDSRPWIRYRQHGRNEIGARGGPRGGVARLARIRDGWYARQIAAALTVARAAGWSGAMMDGFATLFGREDSLTRRLHLSAFFISHGRRRLSDRLMMTICACAGWV